MTLLPTPILGKVTSDTCFMQKSKSTGYWLHAHHWRLSTCFPWQALLLMPCRHVHCCERNHLGWSDLMWPESTALPLCVLCRQNNRKEHAVEYEQ
mmetsp:Transcript_31758/g.91267  ORF Transcript_31758/g.91267 Transcript_31758/m.91267 type:complete len:95 (-) Transcript_31758:1774-2058(-)